MQQLQNANNCDGETAACCARDLLGSVPLIMRFLRSHIREHRQTGLSVPQFRALVFVSQTPEASLSAMAEHVGVSLPAASRMVDLLVRRGLMERHARAQDRRCIALSLTARGNAVFRAAHQGAERALAQQFHAFSEQELATIGQAMQILNRVFAPGAEAEAVESGTQGRGVGL